MEINKSNATKRNSSLDLLKVIGIFLVVLCHLVNSFNIVAEKNNIMSVYNSTSVFQYLLVSILMYAGTFGNSIFVVFSTWFLLEKDECDYRKMFFMGFETWLISVFILFFIIAICKRNIDPDLIYTSLLPISFGTNWYISCYLLFYPLHKYLNKLIKSFDKTTLFRCMVVLNVLYVLINFLREDLFFFTPLNLWIAIYFLISYLKTYEMEWMNNFKDNIIVAVITFLLLIILILFTNYLGLRFTFFSFMLQRWNVKGNPLALICTIAIFNIFRQFKFNNKLITYLSSLSLLVYLFHENLILRVLYRPNFVEYWLNIVGSNNSLTCVLLCTILIFVISIIVCTLYDLSIRIIVRKISASMYCFLHNLWIKLENKVI